MTRATLLLALLALGCRDKGVTANGDGLASEDDADGDGYVAADDCNDSDTEVNPGAIELCDGIDNDCDGNIDEDLTTTAWSDLDGDTFGNPSSRAEVCELAVDQVLNGDDCNDNDADSFPGAAERCDDEDNDCDGTVDNDLTYDWWADVDSDGFGDPAAPADPVTCDPAAGFVNDNTDCDDTLDVVFPGADEICDTLDNDCNTEIDEAPETWTSWYRDVDDDGYGDSSTLVDQCFAPSGFVGLGDDCDDLNGAINPGMAEICNGGIDDDCDGIGDDVDADGDGYFDIACLDGDDCDDAVPTTNPGATDVWYDGVDQDCDGASDYDADGDLVDSDAHGGTDCDDTDPTILPGAVEVWYDGVDQDCDGASDYDADGDLVDSDAHGGLDCDDTDPTILPSAVETWYDGVDQNCDGASDYDADADLEDSDGYGGTDCDDTDPTINLAATEVWYDGVDQDCDGASDYDADGDGVDKLGEGGWDCDDTDATISPRALEVCDDGIDQDCDGTSDGCTFDGDISVSTADFYVYGDADGDRLGQGDPGLASAGDINGDGNNDLILGAIYNDDGASDAGAAYIFLGPLSGKGISAGTADIQINGAAANDLAGRAVVGLGDVDSDGYDDVLITAQGDSTTATNAGAAYLFLGPISSSTSSTADADTRFDGAAAGDLVADAAWAGDIDNDGYNDMLIASQYYDPSTGADAGAATLIYGPVTADYSLGTLRTGDARFIGAAASDEAGSALWGGGDLNGDGYGDVLVAARYNDAGGSNAGTVYVNFGPVTGEIDLSASDCAFTGQAASDEAGFGASVSNAGDINNDGYDDFLAGARFNGAGGVKAGAAYLIHGPLTSGTSDSFANADAIFVGEEAADQTGDAVAGPGDVDGDGNDDVLIGSGWSDAAFSNGGAAYLVLGPVSGTMDLSGADARFLPEGSNDRIRVNAGGDLDGDGLGDILVGAQLNGSNSTTANARHGAAYLFYGKGL